MLVNGGSAVDGMLDALERPARASFESVPLPAEAVVSRTLGRDDRAYHARGAGSSVTFENARHGLEARFSRGGLEIGTGTGSVRLALEALGYGKALLPVIEAMPVASKNVVEYRRGLAREWYVNGPLGVEQGFTLARRPAAGEGLLTLRLGLSGIRPSLLDGGRGLELGNSGLRYSGLLAFDASRRELPARLELRPRAVLLRVDDRAARYPLTVDPFVEQAKLMASDGAGFGGAVAVSEDTIVVGATGADGIKEGAGAAYVFTKPATGWAGVLNEDARLMASNGYRGHLFGRSVAVSGDSVVVGATGHCCSYKRASAYVFTQPTGGWAGSLTENAHLFASGVERDEPFGWAVAISGKTVVVGSLGPLPGSSGRAFVFVEPPGGWAGRLKWDAMLTASDVDTFAFGLSVAVSGETVVVGSLNRGDPGLNAGRAYVFTEPAGGWAASLTEDAKLTASDAAGNDLFGDAVAVSGSTVVVGAPWNDDDGEDSGAAYVFRERGGGWAGVLTEDAKVTASDAGAGDSFGDEVGVSQGTAVVVTGADSVYVFREPAGGWAGDATESEKLAASDPDVPLRSVAIWAGTVAAVAPGSAYVFTDTRPTLDHFNCHAATSRPRLVRALVTVEDQFGQHEVRTFRPSQLCAPASKDGTPVGNSEAHLVRYGIEHQPGPGITVQIENQFGQDALQLGDATGLHVPAAKSLDPDGEPGDPPTELDAYLCYEASGSSFTSRTVTVEDQFGAVQVTLYPPRQLCAPASTEVGAVFNRDEHLVCYPFKPREETDRPVATRDQFARLRLTIVRANSLCVPSTKEPTAHSQSVWADLASARR